MTRISADQFEFSSGSDCDYLIVERSIKTHPPNVGGDRMKIQIRPRGVRLTKAQCVRLERDLDLVLARFGERIGRVIVEISEGEVEGFKFCEIEVRLKPQIVRVEHSDADVFLAMEHAGQRVARSVSRAIETEGLVRR